MRSFLEISVSDKDKAQIDYIDTDRFVLPEDTQGVWCHPDDSQISSMWIGQHELMLGQPIYVNVYSLDQSSLQLTQLLKIMKHKFVIIQVKHLLVCKKIISLQLMVSLLLGKM